MNPMGLLWIIPSVAEVLVSVLIHLCYLLVIMSYGFTHWKPAKKPSPIHAITTKTPCNAATIADNINDKDNDAGGDAAVPMSYGQFFQGHQDAPIVLIHGIFGFGEGKLGGLSYWGGIEKKDKSVLAPDLGSLTSIHDRACELFFFLKGGMVDYGDEHSHKCGHSRFGRTYLKGFHSEWDEEHPIHAIGHSSGAQVARLLQQMLADKAFENQNTSADWILSITALSGALNGTTRVYIDGIKPEDGCSLRAVSLLVFLRIGVLLYEWLDIPILKRYYSFGFEHYQLTWHKVGLVGLVKAFMGKLGPFAANDWIMPDLSIQLTLEVNKKLKTHANTYYFSYATKRTKKLFGRTLPSSIFGIHPLLLIRTFQISQWRNPPQNMTFYEGYKDEDWHDNDGAVNTISMRYPCLPEEHPHCFMAREFVEGQPIKPGIWHYALLEADHIFFIIDRQRAGIHYDVLYDSIFYRCRNHLRPPPPPLQKPTYDCCCIDVCVCNPST